MANCLEWDWEIFMAFRRFFLTLALLACSHGAMAQDDQSAWNGTWIAEGTLFSIRVLVENGAMTIQQIESLGFVWSNKEGVVNGNVVEVEVDYAGVNGIIQAELIDENTAIAFAKTCLPDFMVVCVLAKDRQAVFRRTSTE